MLPPNAQWIVLPAYLESDLNWEGPLSEICSPDLIWEFKIDLCEDELAVQATALAFKQFSSSLFPRFQDQTKGIVLYRGVPLGEEQLSLLRFLSSFLPEDVPLFLIFDLKNMSRGEALTLCAPDRFDFFEVILEPPLMTYGTSPRLGVCFPSSFPSSFLETLESLLQSLEQKGSPYRILYETHLSEQWEGLDRLIVFRSLLSPRGRRTLLGFQAAGGEVEEV